MTQTSGPVHTGCVYFNLLFTICQAFFNKKEIIFLKAFKISAIIMLILLSKKGAPNRAPSFCVKISLEIISG